MWLASSRSCWFILVVYWTIKTNSTQLIHAVNEHSQVTVTLIKWESENGKGQKLFYGWELFPIRGKKRTCLSNHLISFFVGSYGINKGCWNFSLTVNYVFFSAMKDRIQASACGVVDQKKYALEHCNTWTSAGGRDVKHGDREQIIGDITWELHTSAFPEYLGCRRPAVWRWGCQNPPTVTVWLCLPIPWAMLYTKEKNSYKLWT